MPQPFPQWDSALFFSTYMPLFIGFFVFALFHTYGAHEKFKAVLSSTLGVFFVDHFWRFLYCLVSWLLLYPLFFYQMAHLNIAFYTPLFVLPLFLTVIADLLHVAGIAICYWAFLQFDYLSFLGFRQMIDGIKILCGASASPEISVAGINRLEIKGVYRYMRHPMLTGAMLIVFPSVMTINNLVIFFLYLAYVKIGRHYEEVRLIKIFGEQYVEYKKNVGAFVPRLFR
jgi:methanethiol S-methyltransferase